MTHRGSPLPAFVHALEARTLYLDQWHTPATDYPEAQIGNYRTHKIKYTHGTYRYWGMDGYLVFKVEEAIPITALQQRTNRRWAPWMVDDPPNYRAMQIYAEHAQGRVLVAGLGLGLYLHELAKNPKVEKVTVVEISPEVISLVEPHLPSLPEFVILNEDFLEFIDYDHENYDTILVDLWVSRSADDKLRILYHNILPLIPRLALRYPGVKATFHGFQTVSDIKPVSEEMVKLIMDIGGL